MNIINNNNIIFDLTLFSFYITIFNLYFDSYVCNKLLKDNWRFHKKIWIFNLLISLSLNCCIFYFFKLYVFIFFAFNMLLLYNINKNNSLVLLKHLAYLIRKKLIILVK